MTNRRSGQGGEESQERSGEMVALETTRSANDSSSDRGSEPKKDEEHISVFWRVFGGTILSIVALVTITLYNNLSTSITELRAEVSREREARAELVKKDEFNTRVTAQYERMRGIDTVRVELEGVKEKVHTNATAMDGVKRDAEALKKDAAALEVLKERVTLLEALKKDIAGLDVIKEKLATTAADLKTTHDEVQKITGEVDRNKISDLERKSVRDSQYKQVDESLKELQKELQNCREKLARIEGSQPRTLDLPIPFVRPGAVKPDEK